MQWWEVGKAQIKVFARTYSFSSTIAVRRTTERLEKEIEVMEEVIAQHLEGAKSHLNFFLQGQSKGVLVRGRFLSAKDMDAPTKFFFGLGSLTEQRSAMVALQRPDGTVTSDPATMRKWRPATLFSTGQRTWMKLSLQSCWRTSHGWVQQTKRLWTPPSRCRSSQQQ